jgi:hypothetical protein
MAQTPTLGRVVLARVDKTLNNGADVAPAVITRVWSDAMVNLRVLCDGSSVLWQTSVNLYATAEDVPADATQAAYWPPRV